MSGKNIIAFQGVEGAHADLACRQAYPYYDTKSYPSFDEVLHAVESGEAEICMIPVENSQAGRVAEIHNLLPKTKLYIVGEYFQRIEHFLAAPKGATLKSVKTVYSHPQALMQCHNSVKRLKIKPQPYSNTAAAAKDIAAEGDQTKAVICSRLAAELYGLEILKENFEDDKTNTTSFIVMSAEPADHEAIEGRLVTSFIFTLRNIPAALYKSLGGFATNGVNMLKIESYIPNGHSQMAQFFITFEGHPGQKSVQLALEELGFFSKRVKMLGVYPADESRFL